MPVIGQYRYNLILIAKGRDEGANGFAQFQVIEQLQFILYPHRTARNIYPLDGNIPRPLLLLSWLTLFDGWRHPMRCMWRVDVPVVDVVVVVQIFGFIDSRKGTLCISAVNRRLGNPHMYRVLRTFANAINQSIPFCDSLERFCKFNHILMSCWIDPPLMFLRQYGAI